MLVLNRKTGEAIIVADRTIVKIVRIFEDDSCLRFPNADASGGDRNHPDQGEPLRVVSISIRGWKVNDHLRIDFMQHEGQSFRLDDQVNIGVTSIREGRVRLAIDAPREIKILRDELLLRV